MKLLLLLILAAVPLASAATCTNANKVVGSDGITRTYCRVNRRTVCTCAVGSCTGGTAGNGWCVPVTQPPNPPTCVLGQSGCATGSCSQPCPAGIDPNTSLRGSGVCVNNMCQLLCAIDGACSDGAGNPTCACPHKNGVLQVCGAGLPTPGPSAVCA